MKFKSFFDNSMPQVAVCALLISIRGSAQTAPPAAPPGGVKPPASGAAPPSSGVVPPSSGVVPPASGVVPPSAGRGPPAGPGVAPVPPNGAVPPGGPGVQPNLPATPPGSIYPVNPEVFHPRRLQAASIQLIPGWRSPTHSHPAAISFPITRRVVPTEMALIQAVG